MSWWRKMLRSRPVMLVTGVGKAVRWTVRLLLLLLVADLFYLAVTWPDWRQLASGPVPKSAFIQEYEREHNRAGQPARVRWQPVPLTTVPKIMQRAVIVAEDSRFYEHSGFDLIAFREAMERNVSEGRLAVGASTISQQTVKNLFLSSSKTPLRKWHELVLSWGMERHVGKRRILELYLNIAEFGPGVYGVQAAAQTYWGVSAAQLDMRQAAELAATLPSPVKNNPATRTAQFERRLARILRLLMRYPGDAVDPIIGLPELLEGPADNADALAKPEADIGTDACEDEDDDCPAEMPSKIPALSPAFELPAPLDTLPRAS